MKRFRIHPSIGIARLGNADRGTQPGDGWFIGPETPGEPPNWDFATGQFAGFKKEGRIKAQAARFRVWEYHDVGGKMAPLREVNLDTADVAEIRWKVEVANRKASFFQFDGQAGAPSTPAETPFTNYDRFRNGAVTGAAARRALEIAPGPQTLSGRSVAAKAFTNPNPVPTGIPSLGDARTDEAGRLLVLGGFGHAASPGNSPLPVYANNDGWFDDVSDGPVTATVVVRNAAGALEEIEADGAWVLVGPPDFGPPIRNVVTLYDTLVDVTVRLLDLPPDNAIYDGYTDATGRPRGLPRLREMKEDWNGTALPNYRPSYLGEIFPVLYAGHNTRWVYAEIGAGNRHTTIGEARWKALGDPASPATNTARNNVFRRLRPAVIIHQGNPVSVGLMPKTLGDEPYNEPAQGSRDQRRLALPEVPYALMQQWKAGTFESDFTAAPVPPAAPDISPEGLDRAALENAVGGAFYPGIEASWLLRDARVYSEPFRIAAGRDLGDTQTAFGRLKIGAGFFSQQMALPWHADFMDCKREDHGEPGAPEFFAWWPGQRPDEVLPSAGAAAMESWVRNLGDDVPNDHSGVDGHHQHASMVKNWWRLGFVLPEPGGKYIETDRDPSLGGGQDFT